MNKNQQQQGDVLLFKRTNKKIDFTGAVEIPRSERGFKLADGEVTGHAHVIDEEDGVQLLKVGNKTYAKVDKKVTIEHEEHKFQTLTPGVYEFGRVKEYDYFTQMEREVRD